MAPKIEPIDRWTGEEVEEEDYPLDDPDDVDDYFDDEYFDEDREYEDEALNPD